jgi:hypothetical protein
MGTCPTRHQHLRHPSNRWAHGSDLQACDTKLDYHRHLGFVSRYLEEIGENMISLECQVHGEVR